MKTKFVMLLCVLCFQGFAQTEVEKAQLKNSYEEFVKQRNKLDLLKKEFDSLKNRVDTEDLDSIVKSLTTLVNSLNIAKAQTDQLQKTLWTQTKEAFKNGVTIESVESWLPDARKYIPELYLWMPSEPKTEVYTYFGKNQVINNNIFKDDNSSEALIFKQVMEERGEQAYLGDILIPAVGSSFHFYTVRTAGLEEKGTYYFKKVNAEIRDGYFYDIVVQVTDTLGNTHFFSNSIGVSLLYFPGKSTLLRYLYSHKQGETLKAVTDQVMADLYIKLTDVFIYNYRVGSRYIPSDLVITLPAENTNTEKSQIYHVKEETHLEKMVELRAYTDFLAMFGNADNGLAQFEGKAKFYLFPYPFRFLWSQKTLGQIEYFSSLSPHVSYSRFENGDRYASLSDPSLALVQKRFLSMGLCIDVLKWQQKNTPLCFTAFAEAGYNVTELNFNGPDAPDTQMHNAKAFSYGGGAMLSSKRFNNFGFHYKMSLQFFNYKGYNDFSQNEDAQNMISEIIPAFRNEAEVYYHPNGGPNQAIFARLIAFNHQGSNPSSFYQFQFGYKFAIGNRVVNK